MSFQNRLNAVEDQLRSIVLDGARKLGKVHLHTHHADNYWTVTVEASGTTRYQNYAEEARGPRGTLSDLALWELAMLAESLRGD